MQGAEPFLRYVGKIGVCGEKKVENVLKKKVRNDGWARVFPVEVHSYSREFAGERARSVSLLLFLLLTSGCFSCSLTVSEFPCSGITVPPVSCPLR